MARWRRKSLARDTRGVTIIEFALLAPIFFAILTAILQTSLLYFAAQVLESGVADASRNIRVGQAQRDGWTIERFKADVCDRLFGLFGDCADMHVTVTEISSFAEADYSVPLDLTCEEEEEEECEWTEEELWLPGVASSIVLVQVFYRYPTVLQLPVPTQGALPDGRRLLSAATVFRNEPF